MSLTRRGLLAGLVGGAGVAAVGTRVQATEVPRKYLINLACFGGASMLDMFLPLDVRAQPDAPREGPLLAYEVATPKGSALSCPDREVPVRYLERYAALTAVVGLQSSTLVHQLAQERILNGRGAFAGRTSGEAVAAAYGADLALPHVNMGFFGYITDGTDDLLPESCRHEFVEDPATFALATHGYAGVLRREEALPVDAIEAARRARDRLEGASPFGRTFLTSLDRQTLLDRRVGAQRAMEEADLVRQLMFREDGPDFPLAAYGLERTSRASLLRDHLPAAARPETPRGRLQAQAALAWLLLASGNTVAVTLCSGVLGDLQTFDTHQLHVQNQAVKWDEVLEVVGGLVELLGATESPHTPGTSLLDHTLIALPTDFGRDKRLSDEGGTSHHLNNAMMLVSPRLSGNRALGRTDPRNGWISGFNPDTGEPTPFMRLDADGVPLDDDPNLPPGEERLFGAMLDLLDVSYDGQQTIPALRNA